MLAKTMLMGEHMNIDLIKHRMLVTGALQLWVVVIAGTVLRPLFVQQSILFTLVGLVNIALTGSTYFIVRRAKPARWHSYLVISCGFLALLPLIFMSGGIDGQFMYLLPLSIMFCTLVSTVRVASVITGLASILIVLLYFFADQLPNYNNTSQSPESTVMVAKTFWLVLSCLLALSFSAQFDSTNRKLSSKLHDHAYNDELSGVSNRRSVLERLTQHLEQAKLSNSWLTVMMLDLDHFKQINDQHGHLIGDECIKKVGQCLKQSVRSNTDIVGRYGGEEFLLVFPNLSDSKAVQVAEQLLDHVRKIDMQASALQISATIGVVSRQVTPAMTAEHLLRLADQALYQGKHAGRDRVMVSDAKS